jgi:hypothetical protein
MGIQGEFKEYQNTGSYAPFSLLNPPPTSGVFWNSTSADLNNSASFQTIYVAAAATFTVLSGSIDPPPLGVSLVAGTNLVGRFTKIRLSAGSIIAYQGIVK